MSKRRPANEVWTRADYEAVKRWLTDVETRGEADKPEYAQAVASSLAFLRAYDEHAA